MQVLNNNVSLRQRVLRAGGWTIFGHVSSQVLRLGGNLILTRLLFPEAFGLMAIVQSVVVGLTLLSDIGISASIIHNKRGVDRVFVNTAWTMRVIQGVSIWLLICMLAPYVSSFYMEPMLLSIMPVVGFGAVLGGLVSTKIAVMNRSLVLKQFVIIEVATQAIGLFVMIIWALASCSIWSLVCGGLVSAFIKMVSSHLVLEGECNNFAWDRDAVKELFGFGKWMFVSSALTFMVGEGNKLLLGAFLGIKLLAFYTLASTMNMFFWQVVQKLSIQVMFPAYSEVFRERPERLREAATKSRMLLIVPAWLVSLFFLVWGDHFMWLLYDQRYSESGAMLRILSMGGLIWAVGGSYNGLLWAKGMVKLSTVILIAEAVLLWGAILLGNYYIGQHGVVFGVAIMPWLLYPIQAYIYARIGLWSPKLDLPFIAVSVLFIYMFQSVIVRYVI